MHQGTPGKLLYRRMVVRLENFLRDGARHHAPCCGKGQQILAAAIFKRLKKNARIGDRSPIRALLENALKIAVANFLDPLRNALRDAQLCPEENSQIGAVCKPADKKPRSRCFSLLVLLLNTFRLADSR